MNILHISNFSWFYRKKKRADDRGRYYTIDRKITNGLIRNGHSVWDFSYRDTARYYSFLGNKSIGLQRMQDWAIELTRIYQPDIILLGHCELISVATLKKMRQQCPNCKIGQWWVDFFHNHCLSQLKDKQSELDAFFATTCPSYYSPLLGGDSKKHYFFPNIVDSSIETERAFTQKNYQYDLFFAGKWEDERRLILEKIKQNKSIRCGFYGDQNFINSRQFVQTLGKSKMGLNLSLSEYTSIPLYSSDRLAQMIGNGCLAISPEISMMSKLFSEKEMVYYDNPQSMLEAIQYYNTHDEERCQIAKAAWERAHREYNEKTITQYMIEALTNTPFSVSHAWM